MEFPTFVYRCPGPHWGPPRTTYGTLDVACEDDLKSALAHGWHLTLQAAVDAFLGITKPVDAPAVEAQPDAATEATDDAPPTRAEMMQQAELRGLKVDRRWSDETLLAKINAAMAADDDPI